MCSIFAFTCCKVLCIQHERGNQPKTVFKNQTGEETDLGPGAGEVEQVPVDGGHAEVGALAAEAAPGTGDAGPGAVGAAARGGGDQARQDVRLLLRVQRGHGTVRRTPLCNRNVQTKL